MIKLYSVWNNKLGGELVCLDEPADRAAEAMGLTLGSFRSAVSRTQRKLNSKWEIDSQEVRGHQYSPDSITKAERDEILGACKHLRRQVGYVQYYINSHIRDAAHPICYATVERAMKEPFTCWPQTQHELLTAVRMMQQDRLKGRR